MARPFSSDLSVAEAFVVREAGFAPIAQVMGSCFYQVGWQSMPWGQLGWTGSMREGETFELETQTAAWNDARSLALGRLRDEAVAAGADAVVGLRLKRGGYDWAAGLVEFVAIGTAVRSERYEIEDAPVLSHLSGQDFAKLVRHGFWPVGLVAGSTVAYVVAGYGQQARSSGLFSGRQNQELPDYTRGMYDARALAMERAHARGPPAPRPRRRRGHHRAQRADARPRRRRDDVPRPDHRAARARHRDRRGAPRRAAAGEVHRPTPEPGGPMSDEQEPYDPTSMAGVPEHGRERLERMRDRSLFTSDLSVNEFLLVRAAGFEPLGLVVGTSIYHIGFQMGAWSRNQEMDVLTQAMYHARELAMTRMEEEADQLGADGIVAVRLEVSRRAWGNDLAEFVAIGTAVRHREGELHRAPNGRPFTSDLSGQDFYTLLSAGYRPVGMVMGTCVYHVAHQGLRTWMRRVGRNVEMPNFTQALYDARELAMERMQAEAEALEAEGVVGVQLVEGNHGWSAHVLEYFSVGTAVIPTSDTHEIPPPTLTLSLNDSRQDRLTGF